jgi:hypothetical protein
MASNETSSAPTTGATSAADAASPDYLKYADAIYGTVKAAIASKTITAATITLLVVDVMVEVEKLTTLVGAQKEALAIYVISRLVNEIPADQADRATIKSAVDLLLPGIIKVVVMAASGLVAINPAAAACCAKCGCGCAIV